MNLYCQYADCKCIAEIQTGYINGNYCKKHYLILKKKNPKLVGKDLQLTEQEKEILKLTRNKGNIKLIKRIKPYNGGKT